MSERLQNANYGSLNERQRALIDAIALIELETGSSPDDANYNTVSYTMEEVAETMQDELGEESYQSNGSTVFYLKKRRDLIDERKVYLANDRNEFEGEEETNGIDMSQENDERVRTERGNASYERSEKGIDATMQHISDRPVKQAVEPDTEEGVYELKLQLDENQLFDIIRNADEQTARAIFEDLL